MGSASSACALAPASVNLWMLILCPRYVMAAAPLLLSALSRGLAWLGLAGSQAYRQAGKQAGGLPKSQAFGLTSGTTCVKREGPRVLLVAAAVPPFPPPLSLLCR